MFELFPPCPVIVVMQPHLTQALGGCKALPIGLMVLFWHLGGFVAFAQ
jgi:hypothetical protein